MPGRISKSQAGLPWGNIVGKLRDIDGWLRNRLRYCIWTDWKNWSKAEIMNTNKKNNQLWTNPERKRKNLMRLGVDADHAYAWSRTRKGGWRVAQSPILTTTITVKRLKRKGYIPMLEIYTNLNPSVYEPPYTRPAWPTLNECEWVWWCERRTVSGFWQSRLLD